MFIKGNKIENIRIKSVIIEENDYEFYRALNNNTLLVVTENLYDKWVADGLFYNINPFKLVRFTDVNYYWLVSDKQFELGLIKYGNQICTRKSALNFSFILKQMRKLTDISLYDGIYSEEFGFILPTYTNETSSDDALLGTYFAGGQLQHFSEDKLHSLFLTEEDYLEISKLVEITRTVVNPQAPVTEKKKIGDEFTLPGRKELETFFNEHIVAILREPERYKKLGIEFPSSIVLYGPPGCGKTFAVNKLVNFLCLPKFEINSESIASPYIHDTSKKISAMFAAAINSAPSIIVIDEMESYLSNRNNVGGDTHHLEEVAEFLRQIQQAQENKVLIIAMTNMLDSIDPAILRRGRFDHQIEVGFPSEEEITSMLQSSFSKISVADDVNAESVAKQLIGRSLADAAFVLKEAALISGINGLDIIAKASIDSAINALPKTEKKKKMGFGSHGD